MTDGELILAGGALLAAGLAASLLASSFRVPALVLVLGGGMLIGSDGTGWIDFSNYELARTIGVIALSLILFEGGLASGWGEIKPVLRPAVLLAFVGTILTAVMTGLVAAWLFDFSTLEGLLLGSVLAATDAAAGACRPHHAAHGAPRILQVLEQEAGEDEVEGGHRHIRFAGRAERANPKSQIEHHGTDRQSQLRRPQYAD